METIKHNLYDGQGNIIDTFEVPVKPSNETATDIYIDDDFLRNCAKNAQPGERLSSNYSSYAKLVWYKPDDGKPVRVLSMECKHDGSVYEVIFKRLDGYRIIIYLPLN